MGQDEPRGAWGTFMLRRLFLSPVTITSYSPEPQPTLWGGGTSSSVPGKEVCHKIAKASSLDRQLACFDSYVGRLYGLGGVLGGRWTNPKYPLTFVGGQVGVIFGGKF